MPQQHGEAAAGERYRQRRAMQRLGLGPLAQLEPTGEQQGAGAQPGVGVEQRRSLNPAERP
ncbi:MAG: hypothetical protein A3I01_17630 [Betaproteobacteria bacterium RIFCSPLOWO2_02_FULL_65_24]|nr:MAG: hypothetical protein A3I01_17630 [Betaproteobacteria bacterium RIFCSPLOWO2_02_FULL_65_24]